MKNKKFLNIDWVGMINLLLPLPLIIFVFTLMMNPKHKYKVTTERNEIFYLDSFVVIDSTNSIYFNTNGTSNSIKGKITIDTIK
jgi:hypothetical protein